MAATRCNLSKDGATYKTMKTIKEYSKIDVLKKSAKLKEKQLCQSVVFNNVTVRIFFSKFISKHLCRALVFNKVEGWRYNINIKLSINLHFFKAPLLTKSKLTALFAQCTLTHDWLFVIC